MRIADSAAPHQNSSSEGSEASVAALKSPSQGRLSDPPLAQVTSSGDRDRLRKHRLES